VISNFLETHRLIAGTDAAREKAHRYIIVQAGIKKIPNKMLPLF
jgi:hypothetical protein